jgi:hypothetical protein
MTSVIQDWVADLSMMQQSVLISAVRGPDGLRKNHPTKVLCRWLRRSFLKHAFDGSTMLDPYEDRGGSFTGPCRTAEVNGIDHASILYIESTDEIPCHFQFHLMHAAEIIGYKHPNETVRNWWFTFYTTIVNGMHLRIETEYEMDYRLGDSEKQWHEKEL